MKKYYFTFIILVFQTFFLMGQTYDSLTLLNCYELAYNNYPLLKQKEIYDKIENLKKENLAKNFLPQIFISAQATYQSDVTQISLNVPNFHAPELSKDQYKTYIDVNQTILDGGIIKSYKKIETQTNLGEKQSIEVELYKINEKMTQLFYNVLLLGKQEKIIKLVQLDLENKINKQLASIKYGTSIEANVLTLKAELLKLEQQIIEIKSLKNSTCKIISEFIGKQIDETTIFIDVLDNDLIDTNTFNRPEIRNFFYQKDRILAYKNLSNAKLKPKFNAFGQYGYGKPGLNMFQNEFDTYYLVGLKLQWNIWNWNQTKNEKKIYNLQSAIIDNQIEIFNKNLKNQIIKELEDIEKIKLLIEKDEQILNLKNQILKSKSSQLDNGIITSTDYITEVNSKLQSELNHEYHLTQLQLTKYNIKYITGKIKLNNN